MKKAALGILVAGTTVIIAGCGPGGGTSDPLVIGGKPWT